MAKISQNCKLRRGAKSLCLWQSQSVIWSSIYVQSVRKIFKLLVQKIMLYSIPVVVGLLASCIF